MATATENNVSGSATANSRQKNDARRVRRGGKVPAVLYGAGKDALSVASIRARFRAF